MAILWITPFTLSENIMLLISGNETLFLTQRAAYLPEKVIFGALINFINDSDKLSDLGGFKGSNNGP